jgi:hypothetical protein
MKRKKQNEWKKNFKNIDLKEKKKEKKAHWFKRKKNRKQKFLKLGVEKILKILFSTPRK